MSTRFTGVLSYFSILLFMLILLCLPVYAQDVNLVQNCVRTIVFSPDGKLAAAGTYDGKVRVWDMRKGTVLQTINQGRNLDTLIFTPDCKTLIISQPRSLITTWDPSTGLLRNTLAQHSYDGMYVSHTSLAISPDGRYLYGNAMIKTKEGSPIVYWDLQTGQTGDLAYAKDCVLSLTQSADGKLLLAGGLDDSVTLITLESGKVYYQQKAQDPQVRFTAFSRDAGSFMTIAGTDVMQVWDTKTGKSLGSYPLKKTPDSEVRVMANALSPNQAFLAGALSDGSIKVWDTRTFQPVWEAKLHTRDACAVTFSPDGTVLASGDYGGAVIFTHWPPVK